MSRDWIDYLKSQGAQFSTDRKIIGFPSDHTATESTTSMCVLSSQGIVEARGPDTERFLQGQLSCNMTTLEPMRHTPGVVCTPKGRMYSSFCLINTGNNYLFRMHAGLTEPFIANLGKYAVFYKSELSSPAETHICLGLTGDNIDSVLTELWGQIPAMGEVMAINHGYLLKASHINNCYELWLPETSLPQLWEQLIKTFTPGTETRWRQQHIRAVIPQVLPEYIEKYIPQHLNFPSLGRVSFRKGCYTGQEIVARMQNLGQQKSRTYHIHVDGGQDITSGPKLVNEQGKAIGEILETATINKTEYNALAVIRIDAAEAGDVKVASDNEAKVTVHTIPYPINSRAELQQ